MMASKKNIITRLNVLTKMLEELRKDVYEHYSPETESNVVFTKDNSDSSQDNNQDSWRDFYRGYDKGKKDSIYRFEKIIDKEINNEQETNLREAERYWTYEKELRLLKRKLQELKEKQ